MRADTIIAIAAVLIGTVALAVSIWEGLTNRRHNRLSVRPRLWIQYWDVPSRPLSLVLQNVGVGPAFISKVTITAHGDQDEIREFRDTFHLCAALGLENVEMCWNFDHDEVLAPGVEIPLLIFHEDMRCDTKERKAQVLKLARVDFQIVYESVYGERAELRYQIKSRKLSAVQSNKRLRPTAPAKV